MTARRRPIRCRTALTLLTQEIMERQYRAANVFAGVFRTIIVCVVLFAVIMLGNGIILRRGIVGPLLEYDESIRHGLITPVHGVCELRTLAETYNSIYQENGKRERLMRHQVEHDPLTDLLNRGAFDRILDLYQKEGNGFALILIDVDTFKSVNDTYGHAVGDRILQKVGKLLKTVFRAVDYVCRIGGDEFAIIMVDMERSLYYTITDKITEVNGLLAAAEEGLPAVSLSVGVAFSREEGSERLFQSADRALYYTKEHGRRGCSLSPVPENGRIRKLRRAAAPELSGFVRFSPAETRGGLAFLPRKCYTFWENGPGAPLERIGNHGLQQAAGPGY